MDNRHFGFWWHNSPTFQKGAGSGVRMGRGLGSGKVSRVREGLGSGGVQGQGGSGVRMEGAHDDTYMTP